MNIGIISDTHGVVDEAVFPFFENCNEIWHAGDIGSLKLLEKLESFKPLKAVHGNIDGKEIRWKYPEDLIFDCEGSKIVITHIGGKPPNYNTRVVQLIEKEKPSVFVCGHSHILKITNDKRNNLLYINPGAAGKQGLHKVRTALRFTLTKQGPANMEILEIGSR